MAVADWGNQRLSYLTLRDGFVRTEPVELRTLETSVGAMEGGRVLVAELVFGLNYGDGLYNPAVDTLVVRAASASGGEDILRLNGREAVTWLGRDDAGNVLGSRQMGLPFGHNRLLGVLQQALVTVDTESGSATYWDGEGRELRATRWNDRTPKRVTSEVRELYRDSVVNAAEERGVDAARVRRETAELLALVPANQTIPLYDRIMVDRERDELWVQDASEPGGGGGVPRTWTVLNASGRAIASLSLPAEYVPVSVRGERLLVTTEDALDRERLLVMRILR